MTESSRIEALMRRLAQMTQEERDRFIGKLHHDQRSDETGGEEIVGRLAPGTPRPGSFWQEQMWFLDQLSPGAANYNAPVLLRLEGPLDVDALTAAISKIVQRHDILRTTLARSDGQVLQIVAPPDDIELPYLDLSGTPDPEAALKGEALRLARAELGVTEPPLYRTLLVQLDVPGTRHAMIWVASHAIFDGWSVGVLLRELGSLYAGDGDLPPLRFQFADFAHWQHRHVSGSLEAELQAFWQAQLDGVRRLDFPFDKPVPAVPSFVGETHEFSISQPLAGALIEAARAIEVTPYAIFLATYFLLLSRWTGASDLCVGTATAGRSRPEFEPLIGPFQNVVGIRSVAPDNPPFREFARGIWKTAGEAFARQDLSFARIVQRLDPERDCGRNPLWQTFFGFGSLPAAELDVSLAPGLRLSCEGIPNHTVKFDFEMTVERRGARFFGRFDYCTDLFDPTTPTEICRVYQELLAAIAADIDTPVDSLRAPRVRTSRIVRDSSAGAPEASGALDAIATEVARIWAGGLGVSEVGWHDDFFTLGGHSLAAADLVAKLRGHFEVDLTLRDFLGACTVFGVAARIAEIRTDPAGAVAVLDLIDGLSDEEVERMVVTRRNSQHSEQRNILGHQPSAGMGETELSPEIRGRLE